MSIAVVKVIYFYCMDYTIIKQVQNYVLIGSNDKYYILRIDRVGKFFCKVRHPMVAGKDLMSSMDIHGLAEVAKVLSEALAHELFDRITAYK